MTFVVAIVAGGAAAVVRYLLTRAFAGRGSLPWAVFIVNSVGSALGGATVGLSTTLAISTDARLILVGGVAGGLTTFSTWSVETVQLFMEGKLRAALANVLLGLAVGLAAAIAGYLAATALS
ncbi:MAG: fluoride exporter [Actinomycetota bacterium]|nr:fluoride exporter [Actinomycetota bacterium]